METNEILEKIIPEWKNDNSNLDPVKVLQGMLNRSRDLILKWRRPKKDSLFSKATGERNPLDVIADLIEFSKKFTPEHTHLIAEFIAKECEGYFVAEKWIEEQRK